ncbi:MAG: hypothetical protein QNK35_10180 [Bacteroides sp.]|nr:hypothetical protein [Bacteroides sp.]
MKTLNGLWKGSYTFDPEFESESKNPERFFELTMQVDDEEEIKGEIRDIVEEDQVPRVAELTGFIDDGEISFIKQYPFLLLRNEKNETIVDESKAHPEIHYHGVISDSGIEGSWEMEAAVLFAAGSYHSQLVSGKWKIVKAEE